MGWIGLRAMAAGPSAHFSTRHPYNSHNFNFVCLLLVVFLGVSRGYKLVNTFPQELKTLCSRHTGLWGMLYLQSSSLGCLSSRKINGLHFSVLETLCMYVCVYVCAYIHIIYKYVCIYVYRYVCVYIYA